MLDMSWWPSHLGELHALVYTENAYHPAQTCETHGFGEHVMGLRIGRQAVHGAIASFNTEAAIEFLTGFVGVIRDGRYGTANEPHCAYEYLGGILAMAEMGLKRIQRPTHTRRGHAHTKRR